MKALRFLVSVGVLLPTGSMLIGFLMTGCLFSEERVAGGGGVDVEGITVEGTAMHADRSPAVAATVRIRTWDYLKTGSTPKISVSKADTKTDSLGHFKVTDLDTGRYAVEVDAGADGETLLEIDADGSQRILNLEALIQATGTVTGTVRENSGQPVPGATVIVLGMDRQTLTDSSGAFTLTGLPPGTYIIRAAPPTPTFSTLEIPEVQVSAGASTTLDSLVLPVLVPGLYGHWLFDEGKGNVAADAEGSAARAILHNAAAWAPGRDGTALSLKDSAYAFVPKSKSAVLDIKDSADFTVTVWFKADTVKANTFRDIMDTRASYALNGFSIGLAADGRAQFLIRPLSDKTEYKIAGGSKFDDGSWHLISAGRAGSHYFLYADSILLGETTGPNSALTLSNALFFGSQEGEANYFQGLIDDVRIYKHGLSLGEVQVLAGMTP